jgi:ribulose-phosphate 3-epimerase
MHRSVQIDCADGKFVRWRTLGPDAVVHLAPTGSVELHLMVKDPQVWLPAALKLSVDRIAFHIETVPDPRPLIAALRVHHIAPVVAINPKTPLGRLTKWARFISHFLVLGVSPGPSGSPFHSNTLGRIRRLRNRFPRAEVGVDGGISSRTIRAAARAGANRLVVGSAVFATTNPIASYRTLAQLVR